MPLMANASARQTGINAYTSGRENTVTPDQPPAFNANPFARHTANCPVTHAACEAAV